MTPLVLGLCLSIVGLLKFTEAQDSCDIANRMCINGVCELQANKKMACTCNSGYIRDRDNPLLCNPIPTCNQIQGTSEQQCLNGVCQMQSTGAFSCMCYRGYRPGSSPNVCEDTDECQIPATGCLPGTCVNMPGDYFCTACVQGYQLEQNKCRKNIVDPTINQNTQPWLWAWMADSFIF